jgi:hypothetical protein
MPLIICGTTDTNQVELSIQPLLDPAKSQVGDGIPNGWKQQYHLNPFDVGFVAEDPDGDGMNEPARVLRGHRPHQQCVVVPHRLHHCRVVSICWVTWMTSIGKTNALQATAGDENGGYNTNSFADIFIVTNTSGTVTNFLDIGAATNMPARYYRVWQVP